MTKIELFKSLRNFVETAADLPDEDRDVYIEGLDNEISLLARKAATPRKPTATQIENEALKEKIVEYLYGESEPRTVKSITESIEELGVLSNQRVTHLLTALRKAGAIKRTVVKKVPYYEYGVEEGYAATEEKEG